MTIKQQGGIFGRNPTFNDINVDGDITIADKIVHSGDTNTSIRFPASDTVSIETGGSERFRVNSNGNVGIGVASPLYAIDAFRSSSDVCYGHFANGVNTGGFFTGVGGDGRGIAYVSGAFPLVFSTNDTERMRLEGSSGNLLIGKAASSFATQGIEIYGDGRGFFTPSDNYALYLNRLSSVGTIVGFAYDSVQVGSISVGASSTAYNTSSDYRLKENVQPMVGASDRVMALNPVNFAWKSDGSRVDGFLAHEVQVVVPEAVTGEKDAVDADGNPEYQGIDQSKLVPLLTAALQDALNRITKLEAEIATLKEK